MACGFSTHKSVDLVVVAREVACEFFESLGCVHRITDDRVVQPARRADVADHDAAGVDGHANG
jgi:hypothetical protein